MQNSVRSIDPEEVQGGGGAQRSDDAPHSFFAI